MNSEYIELLSEKVHNAWMKEKKTQGFHAPKNCPTLREGDTYHKFKKYCDKCHQDLYPYSELPEHIKEYDRVTVKTVLSAIENLKGD
jgi:hypothetical protein